MVHILPLTLKFEKQLVLYVLDEEEGEEEERGISADTDQDFATESLAENDVLGSKFNSQ